MSEEQTEPRGDVIEGHLPTRNWWAEKPAWLTERLEWFQDLKFGLILHWAPYCQWDCCESWPLVPEDTWARPEGTRCWEERGRDFARFSADYRALNRTFNPVRFDPGAWADAAKAAGMRYVVFTTKHHDGFCMWDTKTTDYRITHPDCPFHADPRSDIVREVFDAFRSRGLHIGAYFSKSDWHVPYYWSPEFPLRDRNPNYDTARRPDIWQRFVAYVHAQVRELLSNYGPIDILWLDGGQVRAPEQDIDMAGLARMARDLQPGIIFADRTVGNDYEDYLTPENAIPERPLGVPWESCLTLGSGWKHNPLGMSYKPASVAIRELVDIVAKGGNLLAGIGPTALGEFDAVALERLREVGRWMDVNGEALYGTRSVAPYVDGAVRFTRKGDCVHAIAFAPEGSDVPRGEVTFAGPAPVEGSEVALLGGGALEWRHEEGRTVVRLPDRGPIASPAAVVRYRARCSRSHSTNTGTPSSIGVLGS